MKRLAIVLFMILIMISLTGCGETTESQEEDMFVCIQPADVFHYYDVVYQKNTKVMYAVSHGPYSYGNFTVLVNPDGTPMLYEAEREVEDDQ